MEYLSQLLIFFVLNLVYVKIALFEEAAYAHNILGNQPFSLQRRLSLPSTGQRTQPVHQHRLTYGSSDVGVVCFMLSRKKPVNTVHQLPLT